MTLAPRKRSLDEVVERDAPDRPDVAFDAYSEPDQNGIAGDRDLEDSQSSPSAGDWQLVEGRSKKKRMKSTMREFQAENARDIDSNRQPAVICAAPHAINSPLRIADLQGLVLYCLADGVGPQWISVKHRAQIRKAVVLMIPGLEKGMFTGRIRLDESSESETNAARQGMANEISSIDTAGEDFASSEFRSPDDFLPIKLDESILPECLRSFAHVFPHLLTIKAPGDDRRVFSPVAAILSTPLSKSSSAEKAASKGPKPARVARDFEDRPTPITAFIASSDDLLENEFVLHPANLKAGDDEQIYVKHRQALRADAEHGWRDADIGAIESPSDRGEISEVLSAGHKVYAIDCEMCKVNGEEEGTYDFALTRLSVVDWNGRIVLDELVKPDKPIVDYVTAFSGMTAEKLNPVTTTLLDVQQRLSDLFTPDSILVGHSLNSDLNAMKMTHPCIVDTSIIYPHPKGPPYKSSLKWLAQKYLNREIQKHDGSLGHDSVEDAQAALDLVKAKCSHGPRWGTQEASVEDIFNRLSRTPRPGVAVGNPVNPDLRDRRTGAVVDYGRPERTIGKKALVSISCASDDEIAAGIKRAAHGDPDGKVVPGTGVDFIFARMRELEALRGWSTDASPSLLNRGNENGMTSSTRMLSACLARVAVRVADIRASLPKCTLLIVYSGIGDPREMKRLSDMQRQFRREYAVKKWDEISVRWTDVEEQALKKAVRRARDGIAFAMVT